MTETRILVLIPARMAATRLPGKPLLDIAGLPMIVHVLRRAQAAQIGRVAVATDTPEIVAAVTAHGFEAVMTRSDHPSGSDRIYEALGKLDPRAEAEIVVNLQGDFPTILPDNIRSVLGPLADTGPRYHHVGLYAYRRAALERFVALAPSPLERQEKLEQLRALEAGLRIDVTIVDTVPRGVDTPADLETARRMLAPHFRSS